MMMRNILKNTRKTALLAKARGMMPKNVVAAPTMTEGPISPRASAILASFGVLGSWFCPSEEGKSGKRHML